ncbi:MAG TPA: DUF222 domain-containing protein [Micromonosporaceae bacterium]|nr:DUF222 domain-containing protein [Micromonosporaceae bacterium]
MRSPAPTRMLTSAGHDAVGADVVEALRLQAREASSAAAGLLAAVVAVADTAVPGFEADEVAFALAWTQTGARRQVEFGRWLTGVQPVVFAAFTAGDIDTARAWVFYDYLATVDDEVAARIAAALLPVAAGLTTSQLRDRLRRAILKADPDAAAKRARQSETERYVATAPDGDGTAGLYGVRLPAGRAMARSSGSTPTPAPAGATATCARWTSCAPTPSLTCLKASRSARHRCTAPGSSS